MNTMEISSSMSQTLMTRMAAQKHPDPRWRFRISAHIEKIISTTCRKVCDILSWLVLVILFVCILYVFNGVCMSAVGLIL